MRNQSLIYLGLFLFLTVITLPFTYNLAAGKTVQAPDLKLPGNATQCVEPTEFMKSSHMQLLLDWRDKYVRDNIREYKASDGQIYDIGLTSTCLSQCHTDKAEFCDRCHSYAGVENPYCMDCHIDPSQVQGGRQ